MLMNVHNLPPVVTYTIVSSTRLIEPNSDPFFQRDNTSGVHGRRIKSPGSYISRLHLQGMLRTYGEEGTELSKGIKL